MQLVWTYVNLCVRDDGTVKIDEKITYHTTSIDDPAQDFILWDAGE